MPLESNDPPKSKTLPRQTSNNLETFGRTSPPRQRSREKRSSTQKSHSEDGSVPARFSLSAPDRSNVVHKEPRDKSNPRRSPEKRPQKVSVESETPNPPKPTISAPESGRTNSRQDITSSRPSSLNDRRSTKDATGIGLSRRPARNQLKSSDEERDSPPTSLVRHEKTKKVKPSALREPLPAQEDEICGLKKIEKRQSKSRTSFVEPPREGDKRAAKSRTSIVRIEEPAPNEVDVSVKRSDKQTSRSRTSTTSKKSLEEPLGADKVESRPRSSTRLSNVHIQSIENIKQAERNKSKSTLRSESNTSKRSDRADRERNQEARQKTSSTSDISTQVREQKQEDKKNASHSQHSNKSQEHSERYPGTKKRTVITLPPPRRKPHSPSYSSDTSGTIDNRPAPPPRERRIRVQQKKSSLTQIRKTPKPAIRNEEVPREKVATERRQSIKSRQPPPDSSSFTSDDATSKIPRKSTERRSSTLHERHSSSSRRQIHSGRTSPSNKTRKISESSETSTSDAVAPHPKVGQRVPPADKNYSSQTQPPWRIVGSNTKPSKTPYLTDSGPTDTTSVSRLKRQHTTKKRASPTHGSPSSSFNVGGNQTIGGGQRQSITSSDLRSSRRRDRSRSPPPLSKQNSSVIRERSPLSSPHKSPSPTRLPSPQTRTPKVKHRASIASNFSVSSNDTSRSQDITSSRLSSTSAEKRPLVLKTILKRSSPTAVSGNPDSPSDRRSFLLRNERKRSWARAGNMPSSAAWM